jgi:hypothetical protein
VKRKPRLCGVEIALEIANTPFAVLEHLQNPDSRLIRQSMKQLGRSFGVVGYFHDL